MPPTTIRGAQVLDGSVQRTDLDSTTVGQAVVRKIVQGSGVTLSSTGADSGTGDVTVSSPVSTDTGNIATLGSDSLVLVPQSQIWSVRLRSYNAVGNPNFAIAQNNPVVGTSILNATGRVVDRWFWTRGGTHQINAQQVSAEFVNIPGTNFMITDRPLVLTLATAQASLAAGDYGFLNHSMEGIALRELFNDVHSVSILIKSTKAGHKFSYYINDPTGSRSYTKVLTIPSANTWTLLTIPNIPAFPPSGTWSLN